MGGYQLRYAGVYVCQPLERIAYLSEVEHPHIYIMRTFGINGNDPETKQIGSGIYSEYDFIFSQ